MSRKVSVRFTSHFDVGAVGRVYFGSERIGTVTRWQPDHAAEYWTAKYGSEWWSRRDIPGRFPTADAAAEALATPHRAAEVERRARESADRTTLPECAACGVDAADAQLDLLTLPDLGWVRLCRDLRDCQRRGVAARRVKP